MIKPNKRPDGPPRQFRQIITIPINHLRRYDGSSLRRLKRWFNPALNLTLLILWLLILYKNRDDLPFVEQMLQPQVIALCLLAYVVSFGIQLGVWASLMGYTWSERRLAISDYVWTTLMGRVPGGIWKIVGRMTIYRASRLTPRTILAINGLEVLLLLMANALVLLVISSLTPLAHLLGMLVLATLFVLLMMIVPNFISTMRGAGRTSKWLVGLAGYVASWVCGGLLVYTLFQPLRPLNFTWLTALQVWCLSGAVSVVLQLLPLSTLFRDVTLVALIKPFLPLHRALIAVLALRLISLASELLIGWCLLGTLRLMKPMGTVVVPETIPPNGRVWEDTTE